MRKVMSLFVVFLLFFAIGLVYAEDSVTSSDTATGDNSVVASTGAALPAEDATSGTSSSDSPDGINPRPRMMTVRAPPNATDMRERVKEKIDDIKNRSTDSTRTMMPQGIAVGQTCAVLSAEDKAAAEALKTEYDYAIKSNDTATAKLVRDKIKALENKLQDRRRSCMETVVPGLSKDDKNRNCTVSEELYSKLDDAKTKIAALNGSNVTAPKDALKDIAELEMKIASMKARCNALKVTDKVSEGDIASYYKERIREAMNGSDNESNIADLKELRKEIDETIKNMLQEKKKLNFNEMSQVAKEIKIRAGRIDVGDSQTNNTETEIDVEMGGRNISFKPSRMGVLMRDARFNFTNITASDITVNGSGIYVNGTLVKMLPSAVFEHNKNMMNNAKRMINMTLESDKGKAVYKATYNAKKRFLGIFPATAKTETTVDANTGEIISEKKPWWSGISSDVKDTTDNSTTTG